MDVSRLHFFILRSRRQLLRTLVGIVYVHLFCACNASHFHHTRVVFVRHSDANILKCQSTQNHEKHKHIKHIMGYIIFRHRKLVVVLMRYINITLLDVWWPPFFVLIDQFLYRFSTYGPKTNKFWKLEVNKKVFFFTTAPLKTSTIVAMFTKKGFWTILGVKEGFRL